MGILVKDIQERCCDSSLINFTIIEEDSLNSPHHTCDKIIECHDKYYLVEEKSLLMAFFNLSLEEIDEDLEDYKYDEKQYLKIDEVINRIKTIGSETKKRLLAETISHLLMSSLQKVSNTTDILSKNHDNTKTNNMPIFYLYCNSGREIDRIMHSYLSRNRKNIFIECETLKEKLEKECA